MTEITNKLGSLKALMEAIKNLHYWRKKMAVCYVCEEKITEVNKYREHIILNAIGGRLKSSELICSNCSKNFDSIDTALANQLTLITCLLNIDQDRGNKKIPSTEATIVSTGEKINIEPGGKPVYKPKPPKKLELEEGYQLQARNLSELKRQMIGLARSNSWLNVDKSMNEIEEKIKTGEIKTQEYLSSPVTQELNVGKEEEEEEFWRAICKMAVNYYMYSGGEKEYIAHLIPYMKDGTIIKNHASWYYPESDVFPNLLEQNKIIHALTIQGNPQEKILYAVIQLYGTFQYVILLNDSYQGNEVNHSYLFDVINREKIDFPVNTFAKKSEIQEILNNPSGSSSKLFNKTEQLFVFIHEKQLLDHLNELNKKTIDDLSNKYLEGEIISDEDWNNFRKEIASYIYNIYKNFL